jgi:hypothetical protein
LSKTPYQTRPWRGHVPKPAIPAEKLPPDSKLHTRLVAAHEGESVNATILKRARVRKAEREGRDWPGLRWQVDDKGLFVTAAELVRYRKAYAEHPGVRKMRGLAATEPERAEQAEPAAERDAPAHTPASPSRSTAPVAAPLTP